MISTVSLAMRPVAPAVDPDIDKIGHLSLADLLRLWQQPLRLFRLANFLRERCCGDAVSFVVNRNINFTNICTGSCRFCSFKHHEPYTLSHEQILRRAADAEEQGATEICLQGGLHPDMALEDYCGILEAIRRDYPRMHLHAYSPMEVLHMSRASDVQVEESLVQLKRAGLGSMPGTAAEILVDPVRQVICPDKLRTGEWRHIITSAHQLGIPTTSTILFGHVESLEDRLTHLQVIREIAAATGGFTEMVLLPFIAENNPLGRDLMMGMLPGNAPGGGRKAGVRGSVGADLLDRLKMHALARVALYPHITNIQASWTKLGRQAAGAALEWGANDLGGTLMDEGIARNACEASSISAEDLRRIIESRGRRAVQRTTLYRPIPYL
jgi:FO synthase subunit 2